MWYNVEKCGIGGGSVAKYARKSKKNTVLTIGSLALTLGILLGLALVALVLNNRNPEQ